MTTPHTLYWDILSWNFEVEDIDMILGHYIEYRGSMSQMPIWVLECSKLHQLEGEARQRGWKFDFFILNYSRLKSQAIVKAAS